MNAEILRPAWSVPSRVRSAMTLRGGGYSVAPFDSLNLGTHVGDDADTVARNRVRLHTTLALPGNPLWLQQVHGAVVHVAEGRPPATPPVADAAVCRTPGVVLTVMVADCLPVLLAERSGTVIAVAHAGWRGLAAGVLEAAVGAMGVDPGTVTAWLGPAISQPHFEVGEEVLQALAAADAGASVAFERNASGRWQCDLPQLARRRLQALGIGSMVDCGLCTFERRADFYSFRRDGRTGRMAALVWLEP